MRTPIVNMTRRGLLELLATGAGLSALGLSDSALAQGRKDVLVIGLDVSDAATFDPALATASTAPVVEKLAYDMLVTYLPGNYVEPKPLLATAWERTPDGKGWRFTLRDGVKFNSGNPMTAEDVKWSFDRVINMAGQPALYIPNVERTEVVDERRVDFILKDPTWGILEILTSPSFVILDRKVAAEHGAISDANTKTQDKAAAWLNQHSCGTGAYTLTSWERNSSLQFERNPHYWGGTPAFSRLIIRHMTDPSTQLLAIQRGDIDVAFNLIPEQIEVVKKSPGVHVERLESVDMVYYALTTDPALNKALAVREARQAISWAIDYDGIRDNLLAGAALHPAAILPIGLVGSTKEVAKNFGVRQDLAKAKELLAKAGYPDGFSFKLTYGTALFAGVSYSVLAQKLQSDLARVGIKVELDPVDLVKLRTQYYAGNSTAVLINWGVSGIDTWLWGSAGAIRLAKRMHFDTPKDILDTLDQAPREPDPQKKAALWLKFQQRMSEEAFLMPVFQPIYQIAIRDRINAMPLTAAGWLAEFQQAS